MTPAKSKSSTPFDLGVMAEGMLKDLLTGDWHANGSSVSDKAITTLGNLVRADFDEDARQRVRAAARDYVVNTRADAPSPRAPDRKNQQSRHKGIARHLVKAAAQLVGAANLCDEERTRGGPIDTSLAIKFWDLDRRLADDPAACLRAVAQALAIVADAASLKCSNRRPKPRPGRPVNPHFKRFIANVAKICIDKKGQLYAKPRKRWNANNQNRASSLAEGLVALIAELPPDVADHRPASALAEYIHDHRLLVGLKSGQNSARRRTRRD